MANERTTKTKRPGLTITVEVGSLREMIAVRDAVEMQIDMLSQSLKDPDYARECPEARSQLVDLQAFLERLS